jgi:hypothetical protein
MWYSKDDSLYQWRGNGSEEWTKHTDSRQQLSWRSRRRNEQGYDNEQHETNHCQEDDSTINQIDLQISFDI